MTPYELEQIEPLIKKHKQDAPSAGCFLMTLFLLFPAGCFKGCGY